jgi:hypothetical protein
MSTTSTEPTSLLPSPRTAAALLVVAAAGDLAEAALSPLDGSSTLKDLQAIADHQGRFEVSVVIGLVATVLFLPGLMGLANGLMGASRRVAAIAGWLLTGAMAGFLAIRLGQAVELATVQTGGDRGDVAAAVDRTSSNVIGLPIMVMFLGGALVGLVLLAIAAWKAGLPKGACVLLAVFQPIDFVMPEHPFPLGCVSHALLLVAFAWIARAIRTRSRVVPPDAVPVLT